MYGCLKNVRTCRQQNIILPISLFCGFHFISATCLFFFSFVPPQFLHFLNYFFHSLVLCLFITCFYAVYFTSVTDCIRSDSPLLHAVNNGLTGIKKIFAQLKVQGRIGLEVRRKIENHVVNSLRLVIVPGNIEQGCLSNTTQNCCFLIILALFSSQK